VSGVQADIDLGALARTTPTLPPPRRSKLRILVPALILLAFLAVLASTLGDLWRGSVEVTVVRPQVVDASSTATSGTPLFQAAGWIEPDPFPIEVTALAPGVVRELLVQQSDKVEAGQVVARLVERDAQLACDGAEAMLAESEAEVERAEAELRAAQANFDAALAVTEMVASARANLEGKRAEAVHREQSVVGGEAQVKAAEAELGLQRELAAAGATGPRQVELAEARLAEMAANLEVMRADSALAAAEARKAQAADDRAQRDFELRIDDRQRVETARAMVNAAKAKRAAVQVTCHEAQLRLQRMEVRAPAAGVVLERLATAGTALEGERAVVCTLYDPASMRVRVDVPQGEVSKVGVGMRVDVLADSRPSQPYRGEVIRLVHKADIQKVTLQVHVKLEDADTLLRPEMLVQARFLALGGRAGAEGGAQADGEVSVVLVPARLVTDGSAWIVEGATRTAVRRRVELGAVRGELVEIRSGLNASDKLIDVGREGLSEGARVVIRGE
jgi:HlyD family secretion protein